MGGFQIVPLIMDVGQTKKRINRNQPRRITGHLQNPFVCVGRQKQFVIRRLYLTETNGRRNGVDGIRKRSRE